MKRIAATWALVVLLLPDVSGCKGVEDFFGVNRKRHEDPSMLDGGPGDGDVGDGDMGDGDMGDGGMGDGGMLDGGMLDAGSASTTDVPECEIGEEVGFSDEIRFGDERSFSLARGLTGFGLAYRPALQGQCEQIYAAAMPATGPFPVPAPVVGDGDCVVIRDLSVTHAGNWWMVWVDNLDGTTELRGAPFDEDLTAPLAAPMRLTTDPGVERSPTLGAVVDTPVLAWITEHDGGSSHSIHTRGLDDLGSPVHAVLDMDPDHEPVKLAVAQMGPDAGALAWVNEQGKRGVWLQPLDSVGAPVGAPVQLSQWAYAGSTVDLATRAAGELRRLGGAAIYSVSIGGDSDELQYRLLGADGKPKGVERTIISAPLRATDPSIAQLGGGYVVAYRALPGGPVERPEIRIIFVSHEGDTQRDAYGRPLSFKLADASDAEARTTLRVSTDGQILVSWMDIDAEGKTVLNLSRRRLDCD